MEKALPSTDNQQRFEQIFTDNYLAVRSFLARRAYEGDVDDLLAEIFTVAWRRLGSIPSDARPWLFAVGHKVLANHKRSFRRRAALDMKLRSHCSHDKQHDRTEDADDAKLIDALLALPEPEREALILIAWDGLSHSETAKTLGCSVAAVAMRLHRARKRLKQALKQSKQIDVLSNTQSFVETTEPEEVTAR